MKVLEFARRRAQWLPQADEELLALVKRFLDKLTVSATSQTGQIWSVLVTCSPMHAASFNVPSTF
jgi:hypothetical protein